MNQVEYSADRVAFNQNECRICLEHYQPREQVVELACRHVFHNHCLNEYFIRCPNCIAPIEGRGRQYTRNEVRQEVGSSLQTINSLFPITNGESVLPRLDTPENSERFTDMLMQRIGNGIIRTSDPVKLMETIRQDLQVILNGNVNPEMLSNMLNRHAYLIIETTIEEYRNKPITDKESTAKDMENGMRNGLPLIAGFLQGFGVMDARITNYVIRLASLLADDPRLSTMFRNRERQFVQLSQDKLANLGTWGRFRYVCKLTDNQRGVISKLPEAKTALKIRKVVVGTCTAALVACTAYLGWGLWNSEPGLTE